jgi:hypothetical protein
MKVKEMKKNRSSSSHMASVGDIVVITLTEAVAVVVEEVSASHEM